MRHTRLPAQFLTVIFILSLFTPLHAQTQSGQQADKSVPDSRMQELINSRRSEHWDFWETQLTLTPAPRLQPVHALPEWYPTGAVVLTLDDDYVRSFQLNKLFRTEDKGDAINKYEPSVINHVKAITCNALHEVESEASELIRHDSEASGRITQFCKDLPQSAKKGFTSSPSNSDDAHLLASIWLEDLKDDEILKILSFAHTLLKIVKDLTAHTNVLILVPEMGTDEDGLYERIELVRGFPGARDLFVSNRVKFAQVPFKTKWIRDYGPIFVKNGENEILCVDPRYHTDRESLQEKREFERVKRVIEGALKTKEIQGLYNPTKEANKKIKEEQENLKEKENRLPR